ncbi:MAG TPA: tRNA-binding protein [Candidatus Baltobacteraceae bacterium]|nr:tRNA-binding protein [Candidatus Baltobacteraceae bacterium]
MIEYSDFTRVDIRAGTILEARPLEGTRQPTYAMRIDFGPEIGVRGSSAQITVRHRAEDLPGTQICAVVNFAPKKIAGFKSEVLVLGMNDENGAVVLVRPQFPVPNGTRLY